MGLGARGPREPRPPARLTARLCPQLEQGLCSGRAEPLSGPAGAVLECLVLHCRTLVDELARPVFYLLEALAGEGPLGRCGGLGWGSPSWPSWSHSCTVCPQP